MNNAINELAAISPNNWVLSKNKLPINPHTQELAKNNEPATWGTLPQVQKLMSTLPGYGFGFEFGNSPIIGLDYDNLVYPPFGETPKGEPAPMGGMPAWLWEIVTNINTYTEYSQSGTGIHIYARCLSKQNLENTSKRPLPQMPTEILYYENAETKRVYYYQDIKNVDLDEVFGIDKNGKPIKKWKPKPPGYELKTTAMYFVMTGSTITGTREVIADIHNTVIEAITLSHTIEKPQTKQRGTTTPKSKTPPLTHTTEGEITILPAPSSPHIYPAWVDTAYQKILNRALDMVKNSSDSDHHNTRIRAGRLMGGALERAKNDGYIYDENITANLIYNASTIRAGEERKGMTAIFDGIEIGRQEPLLSEPIPLTDLGNAQRFYNAWGQHIRYVMESKIWFYWNGRVWERLEGDDFITQLAHKTARSITEEELPAITDTDKRKTHIKWGMSSEGAGRIESMVRSMRPYVGIPANALDTHNHLLCVQNGVVNLKTGVLEPHNPNYYITKMVPIDYTPGAPAPHWERFLDTIFEGDTELIHWIQRVMGYTLTGSTDERCLFFLYGVGKNGKSIFFEVLRMLLVDHLKVTSIEALLQTEQTIGATPYVADLQGARCAMASEMPQGKRFNESLLKTLTGGDTLTARRVFGHPFSFRPTHTLWVSGNYLPRVQSDDPAIWERVRIIPFKNIIQNPRPADELREEFTSELTGILSWVIEGSGLWYEEGKLPVNHTVANATSEYRGQEDIYALFLSECCLLKPGAQTLRAGVYRAFQLWGVREGDKKTIEAITQRMLTEKLKRKGIDIGGSGRMYYTGLVLTDYNHSDEEGN